MKITNYSHDPETTIEIKAVIPEGLTLHAAKSRNKQGRYKFQVTIDTNLVTPDVVGVDLMQRAVTQAIKEALKD